MPSVDAQALQEVRESPEAESRFGVLAQQGRIGGRLAALCGLKLVGSERYSQTLSELTALNVEVMGQRACTVERRPIADILRDIDTGGLCAEYAAKGEAVRHGPNVGVGAVRFAPDRVQERNAR